MQASVKRSSPVKGAVAMSADGTVPSGNSWPRLISWKRLNVEPGRLGELIFSLSSAPLFDAW